MCMIRNTPRLALLIYPLVLLVIFLTAVPVMATPETASSFKNVDDFIEAYLDRNHIPGISLSVAQGNEIVYSKGYGIAGPLRLMTADTPMFIGSQTKSFTALAVMQLVETGLVELDAPIRRYIPWFQVADPQASEQISVRNLLNHTSGLSEAGYAPNLPDSATIEDLVHDLHRARSTAGVGEKFQYFNPGYITLGLLVEVVSGQSFGDYLRQHVFVPLRLAHTSADIDDFARMDIAQGYSQVFAFPVAMAQRVPRYYLPAGFIVSTTNDLARYLMAMKNEGELDGARILSEGGVRAMFTPNTAIGSDAGFGWTINSYYGEKQVTHGGATERFYTSVLILPTSGLSVAMIINQDHMFKATYDYLPLFWGVVDILTGHPVTKQAISAVLIGWGFLAAFLVILFLSIRGLLSLRGQQLFLGRKSCLKCWLNLVPHIVWVLFTLLMVTIVGPSLAGRGFDLRWFIGFYPDVALFAVTVLIGETLQILVKAGFILAWQADPE